MTVVVVTVSVDPTVLVLVTKSGVIVEVVVDVTCAIFRRELQKGVATLSDCMILMMELRLLQLAASRLVRRLADARAAVNSTEMMSMMAAK